MTLPAAHRYALTFFSICLSAIIGYPSLLAASGPCGVGGCLNNATNYITNQGGGMGSCNNTTLPANKETQVASGNAGSYSANPWVYGVSGQVLLYNGSLAEKTFTLNLYIGDQTVCGEKLSCYKLTSTFKNVSLRSGDYHWIPFTGALAGANTADYYAFYVEVTPDAQMTCESLAFYTTEHD
jgi:hypothetical protein